MTTKANAKRELQLIKKLETIKEEIGDRRDRLRTILDDLESLDSSAERAQSSIEDAIAALSEYV